MRAGLDTRVLVVEVLVQPERRRVQRGVHEHGTGVRLAAACVPPGGADHQGRADHPLDLVGREVDVTDGRAEVVTGMRQRGGDGAHHHARVGPHPDLDQAGTGLAVDRGVRRPDDGVLVPVAVEVEHAVVTARLGLGRRGSDRRARCHQDDDRRPGPPSGRVAHQAHPVRRPRPFGRRSGDALSSPTRWTRAWLTPVPGLLR